MAGRQLSPVTSRRWSGSASAWAMRGPLCDVSAPKQHHDPVDSGTQLHECTATVTPAEIIAARRAEQISRMEGRDPEGLTAEQAQEAARAVKPANPKRVKVRRRSLVFSAHARTRMSQRGMSARDVYTLWRLGEPIPSGPDTVYTASDGAIDLARGAPGWPILQRWRGAAIVVNDSDGTLVTVLADGPKTRFTRGKR